MALRTSSRSTFRTRTSTPLPVRRTAKPGVHGPPPHPHAGYWLLPLEGTNPPRPGKPVQLARGVTDNVSGTFSPDGKWFAYSIKESSVEEIYAVDVKGGGRRLRVTVSGGTYPRWRGGGKDLFFFAEGKMMSVKTEERGDVLEIGVPQRLFDLNYPPDDIAFDVTPDGKRFLVEAPVQGSSRAALARS